MYLYDIHTHAIYETENCNHPIKQIINVFPEACNDILNDGVDGIYFSCGVHPWYASLNQLPVLESNVSNPRIVAIGEAGIDKLKAVPIELQIAVFEYQIKLAIEHQKPLIIHCVKAWDELILLRNKYKKHLHTDWIIHGYRGGIQQTKQLTALGFKFSIGLSFNEAGVRQIPLESLFCETDTANDCIYRVYENVSCCLDIEINTLLSLIEDNVKRSFRI